MILLTAKTNRLPVVTLAIIMLVLLGVMAFGINKSLLATFANNTSAAPTSIALQGGGARKPTQVVLITIRHTGISPAKATLPAGRYLLAVDNRSGIDNLSMQFDAENRSLVRPVNSRRATPDWRGLVNLQPGKYKLSVAERPQWQCELTVTQPGQG